MRAIGAVAAMEFSVWLRTRWALAAALLPPLGMGVLVGLLTVSVGQQPVALVVEGHGRLAAHLAQLIEGDQEAYLVSVLDRQQAEQALRDQQVAAVILIPADFDRQAAHHDARVILELNNVDIDFSDDIRRSVARSVAELDDPQLGLLGELHGPGEGILLPSPYRVAIAERDLRSTNVSFLEYELVPVLIMVVLSVGTLSSAMAIARDVERGTARVLLVGPQPAIALVGGKLLGSIAGTSAVLGPLVLAGVVAGAIAPPADHWPALIALFAITAVMASGLGLVIGVLGRRPRVVTMLGLNAAIVLFFLGGGFTTVAFLPAWLQLASRLVPTSYAIEALRQTLFYRCRRVRSSTHAAPLTGLPLRASRFLAACPGSPGLTTALRFTKAPTE
ncbi:MAG TPA: ABC transporter permease, partial [Candidatus Dormibacteraeota bacterium]|nr:ABC transporter permease [Candidatus Dormibacteraeota bacterium]